MMHENKITLPPHLYYVTTLPSKVAKHTTAANISAIFDLLMLMVNQQP